MMTQSFAMIGCCDYVGFGLNTLNFKLLQDIPSKQGKISPGKTVVKTDDLPLGSAGKLQLNGEVE